MRELSSGMRTARTADYYAYLLLCADGSYYAGSTTDPARRLAAHREGRASRYTRGRGPHRLAALWRCPTRRSALRLERFLKRLAHAAKHRLASGWPLSAILPADSGMAARRIGRLRAGRARRRSWADRRSTRRYATMREVKTSGS